MKNALRISRTVVTSGGACEYNIPRMVAWDSMRLVDTAEAAGTTDSLSFLVHRVLVWLSGYLGHVVKVYLLSYQPPSLFHGAVLHLSVDGLTSWLFDTRRPTQFRPLLSNSPLSQNPRA